MLILKRKNRSILIFLKIKELVGLVTPTLIASFCTLYKRPHEVMSPNRWGPIFYVKATSYLLRHMIQYTKPTRSKNANITVFFVKLYLLFPLVSITLLLSLTYLNTFHQLLSEIYGNSMYHSYSSLGIIK